MKRIVVYGLGKNYKRYRRMIEKRQQIVAHCDQNPEKIKEFADGITVEELARDIDSYDEVYVTTSMLKVFPYLRDEFHIPVKKLAAMEITQASCRGGTSSLQLYSFMRATARRWFCNCL